MKTKRMRCGTQGNLDPSLVGFLGSCSGGALRLSAESASVVLSSSLGVARIFEELEKNELQLGVVSLEQLLDHAAAHPDTGVRLLGPLLGGDCRALAAVAPLGSSGSCRTVGAVHPTAALARWKDICWAFDVEGEGDLAHPVADGQLGDALLFGRHSLLELNLFWEGLLGQRLGLIRSMAKAGEFGIPSGFSHLIVTNTATVSKTPSLLIELRFRLMEVYERLLANTRCFADAWCGRGVFHDCPDYPFLHASVRILAPHLEEFVRTAGCLDLHAARSFGRWYQSRVGLSSNFQRRVPADCLAEHLLCDLWG